MHSQIVYMTGHDGINIPGDMLPADKSKMSHQMQGTTLEQLGELACRVCYDSLGNGRDSAGLHKHILEVVNTSVYEHCYITIRFLTNLQNVYAVTCLNRKGVWVRLDTDGRGVDITINFRAILEWDRYTTPSNAMGERAKTIGTILKRYGHNVAPQIFPMPELNASAKAIGVDSYMVDNIEHLDRDQLFVTMYLAGSRGFTHEQVRHRFNMSQRSTRYVDEDGSDYVMHPLITQYLLQLENGPASVDLKKVMNDSIAADRETYHTLVTTLKDFCVNKLSLDPTTARKQARGAARGYLGNALGSEMIFTAPISGWRIMYCQRLHPAADAEIRQVHVNGFRELKESNFAKYFDDMELVPSPDGMGYVLRDIPDEYKRTPVDPVDTRTVR